MLRTDPANAQGLISTAFLSPKYRLPLACELSNSGVFFSAILKEHRTQPTSSSRVSYAE